MSNRNRFAFIRNRFGSGIVRLPQTLSTPTIPPVTHTIDLLELKEPVVVGEPTPGNKIGLKAPSLTSSYQLCLPVDAGEVGEVLSTDGSGVLTWVSAGGAATTNGTGVLSGGFLTINADTTKFDVSDGTGIIFNTTTLVVTVVSWAGLTAQFTSYSGEQTFVSINSSGVPVFSTSLPTNSEIRDNIYLGQLIHLDGINIVATIGEQMTLLSTSNQVRDLMEAIGNLNISGNIISSNALLTVTKSQGVILAFGGNYENDINNPHLPVVIGIDTNIGGGLPNTFLYRYKDGSQSGNLVNILPDQFDDGNGQASPGAVGTNKWQVQRVFTFSLGGVVIQPGQFTYNSKDEAVAAINTEGFIISSELLVSGVLISFIAVKGNAIDLSDDATAQFLVAPKFGGISAGAPAGISGPLVSTNTAVVRWDGTSGGLVQDCVCTITDAGQMSTPFSIVIDTADVLNNTKYGFLALDSITSGSRNVVMGDSAGLAMSTGNDNVVIGYQAGLDLAIARDSVLIGSRAGSSVLSGNANTAIGADALLSIITGSNNVVIGFEAMKLSTNTLNCVVIGYRACENMNTGAPNGTVAIGSSALRDLTNGVGNTAVGAEALLTVLTTNENTALGALAGRLTTGASNTLIGYVTGTSLLGGSTNTLLGARAGEFIATGSSNIAVGNLAGNSLTLADSNNICIGNTGTAGDSGEIRIGTSQVKNFQAGIRGITTDNADAVAVLVDSTGQLGTISSSLKFKENITTMGSVESFVRGCRPVSFNYKGQSRTNYGLIAEELNELAPELVVMKDGEPDTIQYHKLFGFMLKALQECYERIGAMESKFILL